MIARWRTCDTEARPALPQRAYDVLIHILDVFGVAVGKHKAYLEDGAVGTAQHLHKCNMPFVLFHQKSAFVILVAKTSENYHHRTKKMQIYF